MDTEKYLIMIRGIDKTDQVVSYEQEVRLKELLDKHILLKMESN